MKVPEAGIQSIRSKLALKIYDEYANVLSGMYNAQFNRSASRQGTSTQVQSAPSDTTAKDPQASWASSKPRGGPFRGEHQQVHLFLPSKPGAVINWLSGRFEAGSKMYISWVYYNKIDFSGGCNRPFSDRATVAVLAHSFLCVAHSLYFFGGLATLILFFCGSFFYFLWWHTHSLPRSATASAHTLDA